jgi:hypothetical protein
LLPRRSTIRAPLVKVVKSVIQCRHENPVPLKVLLMDEGQRHHGYRPVHCAEALCPIIAAWKGNPAPSAAL